MTSRKRKWEATLNSDPWTGLTSDAGLSGPNARRVSADAPWDFFWARDDGKYALVLRHAAPASAASALPNLRGIEVLSRPVSDDRPAIVFRLQDSQQKDLFVQLCNDIIAAACRAKDEREAVALAIARTWRWHHLLRDGGDSRLSVEEQKGLIGELTVLRDVLFPVMSKADAVNAWVGPTGAPKDFEIGTLCIEAKARRGSATPYVAISSEFQLDHTGCSELFLHVADVALEPLEGGGGQTLDELVARVVELVNSDSPLAAQKLEQLTAAVGYRLEDDYSDNRWSVGELRVFRVTPEFPKIAGIGLPAGVSGVRYSLALGECAAFAIDTGDLTAAVGGACGH